MKNYNDQVYDLVSTECVKEISSEVEIFSHKKSGARVLFALSDDDNKVFNISFKTPPEDDTGVAHIMEHSVLCGSRKYPVKEPFVELMKGSLNTFLNAMTYPDKTIYPVASRNHKDFRNLVDVYLDAVFFPTLSREAFEQEGWHYDLLNDEMQFKGVVFNEMKGVFSSPESYLDYHLNKVLFKDSTYCYESGGYPAAIPDLTYDHYLQFHKEKYHPSNSWIIIYGDVDRDFWLDYLDSDYLGHYEAPSFQLPQIVKQPQLSSPEEITCQYPSAGEDEDSSLISISFVTGDILDVEKNFAMGVLDAILIGSQGSPLKKALLESGLAEDTLDYGYGNETLQTTWSVGLRDTKPENKQKFVDLVFSELKKYSEDGLPEKMVEAALNTCEFQLREANYGSYPKGLVYSINIMNQWLYGDEPTAGLKYENLLKGLKTKVRTGGYFESLIKEVFLDNPHYVVAVCEPNASMEKALLDEEKSRLSEYEKSQSKEELTKLRERNQYLLELQGAPDSEDALATIPHVSKGDIKRTIKPIPQENIEINGVPALYHDLKTQGIVYMQLSFNCHGVSLENYQWLALMNSLLLKVGTNKVKYDDFLQEISCHTGGMSSTVNILSSQKGDDKFGCHLWIQTKVMKEKIGKLVNLLESVFCDVDFSDTKRIKELVGSMVSRSKMNLQNNGDRTARSYLGASLSRAGFLGNFISGPKYFEFLKDIQKALEDDPVSVIGKITEIRNDLLRKGNLLINLTAAKDVCEPSKSALREVVEFLPEGKSETKKLNIELKTVNTGLQAPGGVQYVTQGINLKAAGYKNLGSFDLVNQLLSTGYLWEKVRVQGGAYGCYLTFDRLNGALMLASYRDPNLEKTLEVFEGVSDFLENLEISESGFEKLLIGTFGRLDAPLTPSQRGKLAFNRFLTGVSYEELNELRSELLDSSVEDLKSYSKYFKALANEGCICVHGSEGRLQESSELFEEMLTVGE